MSLRENEKFFFVNLCQILIKLVDKIFFFIYFEEIFNFHCLKVLFSTVMFI